MDFAGTHQTCGSGLARDGGVSGTTILNVPAPSRASPLPPRSSVTTDFADTHQTCGSGLARDDSVSGTTILNVPAPSRASPLPPRSSVPMDFADTHQTCGSGLARDGGVSGSIDVECPGPIAGKPAPTGIFGARRFCSHPQRSSVPMDFAYTHQTCGSGLARDGGGSGSIDVECAAPSRAGSLPPGSWSLAGCPGTKKGAFRRPL